jgi:dienelactone hydrolase
MTRRDLLGTSSLIPLLSSLRAETAPPRTATYPGVAYPDYFRCLPEYLERLAERAFQMRNQHLATLTTPAAVKRRQQWTRETFWKLVGGAPERTPLNVRTVGSFEREHYRVEKLLYESQPNLFVSANLYFPKASRPPYPGVLFQMGHSVNGKAAATYQRCIQGLVQLGYLVLAFDPMGQGERIYYTKAPGGRPSPGPTGEHTQAGRPMLLVGQTATRMQVWDAVRSLDVLAAHPMVDAKRIGATGQSGGGTTTMFLSAVDDRIAAAVVCSGITENFACARFDAPGSTDDAEQDFVGSGPLGFDRWDLLYPLAPKPLLVSVSDRDFFGTYSPNYLSSGWEEFRKLRKIYSVLGHEERLAWGGTPLPHALSYDTRLLVYNWFARWLKNESKRIEVEPPTKLEDDPTLWVSDSGSMVRSFSSTTPFAMTRSELDKPQSPADLKALLKSESPAPGLSARVLKRVPSLTGSIEALEITSAPAVRIPAWLLRPKTGTPIRSVLLLLEPSGRNNGWAEGGLYQALAEEGHIVCAPDLRGVGDLTPEMGRGNGHHAASHAREEDWAWASLILGKPLVGQRVTDILAVLQALRNHGGVGNHPLVIAARGEMTVPAQFAAAIDGKFTALYAAGGLLSFRNVVETEYYTHPLANFVPGILRHTDLTELPGPPRTVLAGVVDAAGRTVPVDTVKAAYSKLHGVEVASEPRWDAATLGSLAS